MSDRGKVIPASVVRWAVFVVMLAVPLLTYEAVFSRGPGRLLSGVSAFGLSSMLLLARFGGARGFSWLRGFTAVSGGLLLLGSLGLLVAGVFLIMAGSYGILMGMMALPLALGVGVWGWTLLQVSLNGGPRRWPEIDEEAARRSPAVQRFDALHRQRGRGVDGDTD